jgi:hypothetical protein
MYKLHISDKFKWDYHYFLTLYIKDIKILDNRSNYKEYNIKRSLVDDVTKLLNFYVEIFLYFIKISQTRVCLFIYFEKTISARKRS